MKIITTVIICLLALQFSSCKSNSKTVNNNSVTETQDTENFDLILSFISKASGIDYKLYEKANAIILEFNKKHNLEVDFEKVPWGREGEVDLCFKLKNLSTAQKNELISSFKTALGSTDMVHILYNQKCVHKR